MAPPTSGARIPMFGKSLGHWRDELAVGSSKRLSQSVQRVSMARKTSIKNFMDSKGGNNLFAARSVYAVGY